MAFKERKKEIIRNMIVIIIGLIALVGVTVNLKRAEPTNEIEPEDIKTQEMSEGSQSVLDIKELYKKGYRIFNEENLMQIVKGVMGSDYLQEVSIKKKVNNYGVALTYRTDEQEQSLSKAEKEQMVLENASVLMSVFDKIDVVKMVVLRGQDQYTKVVYRPDLENYFGILLTEITDQPTFERVGKEFLNSEAVASYWAMKHPYDSGMGEEIETFYKWEFPAEWEAETLPYIEEEIEGDLIDRYGYHLFLQGLNYEHPLMNYYSAYRLIEYYGNSNLDEMLLELASCKSKTNHQAVKLACDFAIKVLSMREESDHPVVFTRYSETDLEGGKILYAILNQKLIKLASWKDEGVGGFEVMSIADNKESVFCRVKLKDGYYFYVIPIDVIGHHEVNHKEVKQGGKVVSKEIKGLIQEIAVDAELEHLEGTWLFGKVWRIVIDDTLSFIYDVEKNSMVDEEEFNQNFETGYLSQLLTQQFGEIAQRELSDENLVSQVIEISMGQEKIVVYEYDSIVQKNVALLKKQLEDANENKNTIQQKWSKGKLIVTYDGNQEEIIEALNELILE